LQFFKRLFRLLKIKFPRVFGFITRKGEYRRADNEQEVELESGMMPTSSFNITVDSAQGMSLQAIAILNQII
jgi:hypothetical protein